MSITPGDFLKLKPQRSEDLAENIKKYILFGSIILGIALVLIITELRSPGPQTDRYSAYSAAQKFVIETQKAPGADFQSVNRAEIKELGDGVWEIRSYFDLKENSGQSRTFFTIQIQFDGSDWNLKHINFEGKKE
ncbi:MAG TPA: hypothetical protein VMT35_03090 [Ignavibacteriaceae bacterium]|nr:hypothetical protein [Ignavibacteriaceae bacterium]